MGLGPGDGVKSQWHPGWMFADTEELELNGSNTQVVTWPDTDLQPNQIWKLIPVKVESTSTPSHSSSETLGLGSLPSYDMDPAGQSSARAQHTEESERDDFGTIVTEVTTITTRRRYRVEDA